MKTPRLLLVLPLLLALTLPAFADPASGADHPPRVLKQVAPKYTKSMRKDKVKGSVIVDFVVDTKGAVKQAVVQTSLSPEADQAALACVQQWTFEPAVKGGRAVNTRIRQAVEFR